MTLLLALATAGCTLTPRWTAIDPAFVPTAINDAGVIVGNNAGGPVSYQNGTVTALPPISGVKSPFTAVDVANNGPILGSTGDPNFPGVFWLSGNIQIPMGAPLVGFFVPKAVNNHLAVAGSAFDAGKAYKWRPDASGYTELHPPAGLPSGSFTTTATDINDAGAVVGTVIQTPTGASAFVVYWNAPDSSPTILSNNLDGPYSNPHILNSGAVYYMSGGSMIRIPVVGGTAYFVQPPHVDSLDAVSQAGRVAGTITVGGVKHGFTSYQGNVAYLDIPNAPAGDYFRPAGINTCGNVIVGTHLDSNGGVVGGVIFRKSSSVLAIQCDQQLVMQ